LKSVFLFNFIREFFRHTVYVQCVICIRGLRRVWLKFLAFRARRTANDVKSTGSDRFSCFCVFTPLISFPYDCCADGRRTRIIGVVTIRQHRQYAPRSRSPDRYVNWERKINSCAHLYNRLKNRNDDWKYFRGGHKYVYAYAAVTVESCDRIFAMRAIFHCDLYVLVQYVRHVTNSTGVWWPRNFKITINYHVQLFSRRNIYIYCYTRCRPCQIRDRTNTTLLFV